MRWLRTDCTLSRCAHLECQGLRLTTRRSNDADINLVGATTEISFVLASIAIKIGAQSLLIPIYA
jgi:hypothetical protein